jgi:phospholipase/lecithinase/hemolysin
MASIRVRGGWLALLLSAALAVAGCGGSDSDGKGEVGANVTSMAVFGDSLSDLGTYQVGQAAAVGGGRFTTNPGRLWVEYVADYYGVTVSKNRAGGFGVPFTVLGGTGYAEGGARVALRPGVSCPDGASGCTLPGQATRPIMEQVAAHIAASGGALSNKQLVLMLGGNNDMLVQATAVNTAGGSATAVAAAQQAMGVAGGTLGTAARSLITAGAGKVVILTPFDIAASPAGAAGTDASRGLLQGLMLAFNQGLQTAVAGQSNIVVVSTTDFQYDVRANPAAYGMVNVTSPACNVAILPGQSSLFCSAATLVATNAQNNYMFADGLHPTAGTHAQFGNYVVQRIGAAVPR